MDRTAPPDISAPSLAPIQPFLGNRILLLLSLGILVVLMGVAVLYKTYFTPQQKHSPPPTTKQNMQQSPSYNAQQASRPTGLYTLFAVGGYYKDQKTKTTPATNSAEFYDFAADKWRYLPAMNHSHAAAATAIYNNKIYVFGGQEGNVYGGTTTVEEFDPNTNEWTLKTPMPHPRFFAQAVMAAGKIYILGGLGTTNAFVNTTVDVYNPSIDSWTTAADLPSSDPGYFSSRCASLRDIIYCPGVGEHAYTLEYNPTSNEWQSLSTQNRRATGYYTWTSNDAVLYGLRFAESNDIQKYDPGTDTLTTIPGGKYINQSYQAFDMIHINDFLYLVGGKFSADPVRDVYIFNLSSSKEWAKTTPLNLGRSSAGIVLLPMIYTGKPTGQIGGGSIGGIVTTKGVPVPNVKIMLVMTTPDGNINFGKPIGTTYTNDNGIYSFTSLPPGKYEVQVKDELNSKLNKGDVYGVPLYKNKQEYVLAKDEQVTNWNFDTSNP